MGFVDATSGTGGGGDEGDSTTLISGFPFSIVAAAGRMSVNVDLRAASMRASRKQTDSIDGKENGV